MSDVRIELADALQPLYDAAPQSARASAVPRSRFAVALLAALLVGSALTITIVWFVARPPAPSVTRVSIGLSGAQALVVGGLERDLALSPDGTGLVYIGANGSQLFVRRMDALEATPLGGLAAPRGPFISPDGAWVGFFDWPGTLKKIAMAGGPAVTLCQCGTGPRGSTWGPNDTTSWPPPIPYQGCCASRPPVVNRPC